jgi:hypothetical protein
MAEISDLIKQLGQNKEEIYSVIGTVSEINEEERVILVKPNNGSADVFDVRLQTVVSGGLGLVCFPALDSEVIITFVSKEMAYVSLFSIIEKIQLNIGDFSLFIDASNMNMSVENIDVIATNTEISSDNVKINASDTQINSDTVKVVSTNFEVQGATIKLSAPLIDLIGTAVNVTGAFTVNGAVALNGAITMNGGAKGGLPTGESLKNKLNVLENDINSLKSTFNSWTPVANDGGTALKTKLNTWHTSQIVPTTQEEISNPEITQ